MRIAIDRLRVDLSGRTILHNVTTEITSGASAALVGRSGVGKTTILRCAAGLLAPTSGTVHIGDRQPRELYGQGMLSYLFQEACLWPHLTIKESLELTYRLHGIPPDLRAIDHQIGEVGLEAAAELYPYQLSVGMKARAAIARAFCIPPKVLLMDEPFASIDTLRRFDLNKQVQALRSEHGCTVVWVTHDVVEALQFATTVVAVSPDPARNITTLDVQGLPEITDPASLSPEALAIRDQILEIVVAPQSKGEEECSIESL
jgi:NitT/TauT family transport system ATP-binding protein